MNNKRWIELLQEHGSKQEFEEVKKNSKGGIFVIMEYRRLQMDRGRGQDITIEQLESTEGTDLVELLQELFLEPLTIKDLQFAKESNVTAREVLDRHTEDRNLRFLSVVKSI